MTTEKLIIISKINIKCIFTYDHEGSIKKILMIIIHERLWIDIKKSTYNL